jgi:hypothetical protein
MKLAGEGDGVSVAKAMNLAGRGHEARLGRDKDFLQGIQGLSLSKQATRP